MRNGVLTLGSVYPSVCGIRKADCFDFFYCFIMFYFRFGTNTQCSFKFLHATDKINLKLKKEYNILTLYSPRYIQNTV